MELTNLSMAGIFAGKEMGYAPCTASACIKILDHYGIDCTGKKAVIVGRSLVVGKPVSMMLLKKNAEALAAVLEEKYPDCEVEVNNGGQPIYYYIISVE